MWEQGWANVQALNLMMGARESSLPHQQA